MAELLPCPFCGYDTTLQLCQSRASGWWYVQCNACNIKGPGVSWAESEPGPSAIHAWNLRAPSIHNTRAPIPATPGEDRVREALGLELKKLRSIDQLTEYGQGALALAERLEAALAQK